jgi:SAM-dependent methyltransferase
MPPNPIQPATDLHRDFGDIDIYLFDQLSRGRLVHGMRVLDAGCGSGRNLIYLFRQGFDVWAVDESAEAVARVRRLATDLAPALADDRFRIEPVDALSLPDGSIDFVISSAVLHFARDDAHWTAMVDALWRVLAPGGILFARLATTLAQEHALQPRGHGRFTMPDGSDRFLVDSNRLLTTTSRLGARLVDPLKTSVVHGLRSMATWVVQKP